MDVQEILRKIAFCYHKKFQELGKEDNEKRDWAMAERALNHLLLPSDEGNQFYRWHEEDFQEFRKFLE